LPTLETFESEPVPIIQSDTDTLADVRILGLHVANVRKPPNGFGAKPESCVITYEYNLMVFPSACFNEVTPAEY